MLWVIYAAWILVNAGDCYYSNKAYAKGAKELSPLINAFRHWFGNSWWIAKMLVTMVAGAAAFFGPMPQSEVILGFVTVAYGVLGIWHNKNVLSDY